MKQNGTARCTFAIYDCPRDYPEHVIVRGWTYATDGKLLPQTQTQAFHVRELGHRGAVSAARAHCKALGLHFLPRNWNDDPVILETWNGTIK